MAKNIVAFCFIIVSVVAVYFGSYLPYTKSKMYIGAVQTKISGFDQLKSIYDQVFSFYSPIGDEESVKFLLNSIDGWVANPANAANEAGVRQLVSYIEPKIFQNNPRHLLLMGSIYSNFWRQFKKDEDFEKAVDYYRRILVIGPNLPHALYSLLSLYIQADRPAEVREIGDRIIQLWPGDEGVKKILTKTN